MEGVYWGYKTNDELETISSSFQENGYVIIRKALPLKVVDELYQRFPRQNTIATSFIEYVVSHSMGQFSTLGGLWVNDDVFYYVWTKSMILSMLEACMGTNHIRLLTDYVVGIKGGVNEHNIVGKYHSDSTSFDIIDQYGISVWIPLTDIYPDTGGSIIMIGNNKIDPICLKQDKQYSKYCIQQFQDNHEVSSYSKGDILLFSQNSIHKTQLLLNNTWMYALIGQFFDGNKASFQKTNSGIVQRKKSCKSYEPNYQTNILHSSCFPKIGSIQDTRKYITRDSKIKTIIKIVSNFRHYHY
ncbi:hypothetical protein 162322538 [Organic Lake phycodnavirus 1]|nr:hypothetical protein 162322538 [Organic Lake phycodnavirus 1]